jgi:hypothetical protein
MQCVCCMHMQQRIYTIGANLRSRLRQGVGSSRLRHFAAQGPPTCPKAQNASCCCCLVGCRVVGRGWWPHRLGGACVCPKALRAPGGPTPQYKILYCNIISHTGASRAPGSSRALLGASRKTENIRTRRAVLPVPSARTPFRLSTGLGAPIRRRSRHSWPPLCHLDLQSWCKGPVPS